MGTGVLIVVAFIAIQLIGDGAMAFYDGSIDNVDVPERIRVVKGINFAIGIILALLCLVIMCAKSTLCSSYAARVPSMPRTLRNMMTGFGRKRKKT